MSKYLEAMAGETGNQIGITTVLSTLETVANHPRLLFASPPAEMQHLRMPRRLRTDRESRYDHVLVERMQDFAVLRQCLLRLGLP